MATGTSERAFSGIDGVPHVLTNHAKQRILVRYLDTTTDYQALERALEAAGFPPANGRWARFKSGWCRSLDLTGREKARRRPSACGNKPPTRFQRPAAGFLRAAHSTVIESETEMIELVIEGMSCMHCVKAVTEALAGVRGVEGTPAVTLDPGGALIRGNASTDELIAAVEKAGYQASLKT